MVSGPSYHNTEQQQMTLWLGSLALCCLPHIFYFGDLYEKIHFVPNCDNLSAICLSWRTHNYMYPHGRNLHIKRRDIMDDDDDDGFERDLREAEEDLKNRDEEDFDEWGNPIQYG